MIFSYMHFFPQKITISGIFISFVGKMPIFRIFEKNTRYSEFLGKKMYMGNIIYEKKIFLYNRKSVIRHHWRKNNVLRALWEKKKA